MERIKILERELDQLENNVREIKIEQLIIRKEIESIKKVEVFNRTIKVTWVIFPYKKDITVVRLTIDEALFILESLVNSLDIKDLITFDYDELEINYV